MILVGTDEGLFRWFEGGPWLTFHSFQDHRVVDLDASGGGVIAVIDDAGRVWETDDNGQNWRQIPLSHKANRATTLAIGDDIQAMVVATKPLALFMRPLGAPLPAAPKWYESWLSRATGRRGGGTSGGTATATADAPTDEALGWIPLTPPPLPSNASVPPEVRVLARAAGGDSPAWLAAISGNGLWRRADQTESWAECAGLPREVDSVRAIPGEAAGLVAGTSDGCRVSHDGGISWTDQSQGLESHRHIRVVEVRPDNPKHWLAAAAPGEVVRAAPEDGLGFALFESKDAGKSWARVAKGFPVKLQYDTIDDIRWDPAAPGFAIIAMGSGECWRTRSGGDWWEPIARQTRAARVMRGVV